MDPKFIKANTAEGYRQQIAELVVERRDHSKNNLARVRSLFPQLYELYRGTLLGRYSPHKNNISLPLIVSTIQSDVARKTQTSFGGNPIVGFFGFTSQDAPIARKREALIDSQMTDAEAFRKGYDMFLTADLYGTTIIQYGWDHIEDDMMVQHTEVLPYTGEINQFLEKKRVISFDGPNFRIIDPLDAYPQVGVRDVCDMDYFTVEDYMDIERIEALSEPSDLRHAIFDKERVAELKREGHGYNLASDDYKTYRSTTRNEIDAEAKQKEKYARPVRLTTMWGRIPSELVPSGQSGVTMRVITIANDKYVLRNRPLPFWNNKIPILAYAPMPDPHYFFGAGKAEIAAQIQIVANRFTNNQLDALDLYIDPVFLANSDAGLDEENLFLRPGKWIRVDGNPAEMIMPLIPNLQGIEAGAQLTEMLWRWMQQGLGIIEDTVIGGQGQRQTAREFLGRSEAVATRLLLESRLFEKMLLEPLSDVFVDLNRQFLTKRREVFILGSSASIDEITGLPIQERTREFVDGWDLVPNYEARAVGSTTRMGKLGRQQALTFLVQALSQSPIAQTAVNWVTFMRDIFKAFDLENVNEIINTPSEQERMLIMLNNGGQPSQVDGTPNSPGDGSNVVNFPGQGVI